MSHEPNDYNDTTKQPEKKLGHLRPPWPPQNLANTVPAYNLCLENFVLNFQSEDLKFVRTQTSMLRWRRPWSSLAAVSQDQCWIQFSFLAGGRMMMMTMMIRMAFAPFAQCFTFCIATYIYINLTSDSNIHIFLRLLLEKINAFPIFWRILPFMIPPILQITFAIFHQNFADIEFINSQI